MNENLYDDLGVNEDATPEEIKKAYRDKAKEHHPDKEGGDADKMAVVNKAYAVLSDPDRRQKYDDTGETKEEAFASKFASFMGQILPQVISETKNVNHQNLVEAIRSKVMKNQVDFQRAIVDVEKQIHHFDNIKNRMSSKKDKTIMIILKENIKSRKRLIKGIENDIKFMKECAEVLNDYNYMVDEIIPNTSGQPLPNDFFQLGGIRFT